MLEVKNLTKSYHHKKALDGVSVSFEHGLYALLGPNGAGKSTLINIITDNLLPDSGEVLYGGIATAKLGKNFRRALGFMPQQQGLYDTFSGRRFLSYMAALKEIPRKDIRDVVEKVAALVNLSDQLDKRLGAYSGGMKQRILIAQAVLGNPELLILDEPTAGLDPKERVRMRNLTAKLAQGRTVIVATHVVSDIETVADEIILLKEGKIAAKGTTEGLLLEFECSNVEELYMKIFAQDESAGDGI